MRISEPISVSRMQAVVYCACDAYQRDLSVARRGGDRAAFRFAWNAGQGHVPLGVFLPVIFGRDQATPVGVVQYGRPAFRALQRFLSQQRPQRVGLFFAVRQRAGRQRSDLSAGHRAEGEPSVRKLDQQPVGRVGRFHRSCNFIVLKYRFSTVPPE